MKTVFHKADSRGYANHGWLKSYHSFSFGSYHDPERMHFGALRVLNYDTVEGGRGFATHPHSNMEIISIPLEGDLRHMDSMGNVALIREGDIQVLSAGTGISHSEYNKNRDEEVKFLQIWIFPKENGTPPRYDQVSIRELAGRNQFYQLLSPNPGDQGVWILQDAWFHMGDLDAGTNLAYTLKKTGNGVYAFILDGSIVIAGRKLSARDGLGIWDTDNFTVDASLDSKVLLIEVPMDI
jgi:redox-sensitive bicupin YhaK (pirin superfamily)